MRKLNGCLSSQTSRFYIKNLSKPKPRKVGMRELPVRWTRSVQHERSDVPSRRASLEGSDPQRSAGHAQNCGMLYYNVAGKIVPVASPNPMRMPSGVMP